MHYAANGMIQHLSGAINGLVLVAWAGAGFDARYPDGGNTQQRPPPYNPSAARTAPQATDRRYAYGRNIHLQ